VGRYEDAADANRDGVEADKTYLSKTHPPDYYAMYVGHNYQFLAYSTAMSGRKADTLEAVGKFREAIPDAMLEMMPGVDWYMTEKYAAMDRFGLWDRVLAEPAPNPKFPGFTGGWLYATASAQAATGKIDDARATLAKLEKLASEVPADYGAGLNLAKDVMGVAVLVVKARIAVAEQKPDESIAAFKEAVAKEDQLAYDEPADWFVPVRHLLGAELMKAGKAAAAETVYREDLKRHPDNGWALFGLAQSLKAQKKTAEAAKVDRQFKAAWKKADVTLTASAF
jgi:tetratricopeptide (TPR) repeat protein